MNPNEIITRMDLHTILLIITSFLTVTAWYYYPTPFTLDTLLFIHVIVHIGAVGIWSIIPFKTDHSTTIKLAMPSWSYMREPAIYGVFYLMVVYVIACKSGLELTRLNIQ